MAFVAFFRCESFFFLFSRDAGSTWSKDYLIYNGGGFSTFAYLGLFNETLNRTKAIRPFAFRSDESSRSLRDVI